MKADKVRKSPWVVQPQMVAVYYNDGSVKKVKPEGALYEVSRPHPAQPIPEFMIAFFEPRDKKLWIGGQKDFYIVTDSGVIGFSVESLLLWYESLLYRMSPRESLRDATHRFDKEVDGSKLLGFPKDILAGTDIRLLGWDFFGARPRSSDFGKLRIENVVVQGQELRLDLKSPTGVFSGSVWVDLSTKRLLKAVRDGKQVFPE